MARTTNAVKHTHQYYRLNGLWFCSGLEGCTHYMPKNMPAPVGRHSRCWGCMKEFLLTPVNMIDDKPMCETCSERQDIIGEWLEEKLGQPKMTSTAKQFSPKVEDQVEVIEADESHADYCTLYDTGKCNCK